ncbi:unnamed protein product [Closterium sp. Yama58-4]|nr:unnamed protein product [Closterium sp. Yama58-4]
MACQLRQNSSVSSGIVLPSSVGGDVTVCQASKKLRVGELGMRNIRSHGIVRSHTTERRILAKDSGRASAAKRICFFLLLMLSAYPFRVVRLVGAGDVMEEAVQVKEGAAQGAESGQAMEVTGGSGALPHMANVFPHAPDNPEEVGPYVPIEFRNDPERVKLKSRPLGMHISSDEQTNVWLNYFHENTVDGPKLSCMGNPCPHLFRCHDGYPNVWSCWTSELVDHELFVTRAPLNCPNRAEGSEVAEEEGEFDESCSHKADHALRMPWALQNFQLADVYITHDGFLFNATHQFVRGGCHQIGKYTFSPAAAVHELHGVWSWAYVVGANFYHVLVETLPCFVVSAPFLSKFRGYPIIATGEQWRAYNRMGAAITGIPRASMKSLATFPGELYHAARVHQPMFQQCGTPSRALWHTIRSRHFLHPDGLPLFNPDWTYRDLPPLTDAQMALLPADWLVVLAKRPGRKRAIINFAELESAVRKIFPDRVMTFNGSMGILEARDLFRRARLYIGGHGAALANMVFMPAQATSWELLERKDGKMASSAAADSQASPSPPPGNWYVHKFGGTCVGTWERIRSVADIVTSDTGRGAVPRHRFVVVSAMATVTNALYASVAAAEAGTWADVEQQLSALREKHEETATHLLGPDGEELETFLKQLREDISNLASMLRAISIVRHTTHAFSDFVVGHGELWSARLLSATIRKQSGGPCAFLDARDVLVVEAAGQHVNPLYSISSANLARWFADAGQPALVVATGFIARDPEGAPTTLKRDGSDLSAAVFGALLHAKRVTIWTDVDGVFSADPRKVKDTVVLSSLSYEEALELSYFGANVLHPRTALPVMRNNIPLLIRNAFNLAAPGTRIGPLSSPPSSPSLLGTNGEASIVKGFATIEDVALVNVEGTGMAGVPGTAADIFVSVKNVGANVIAISQASSEHSVCLAVPSHEAAKVAAALRTTFKDAIAEGHIADVAVIDNCAVLAAVGKGMPATRGVSAALFGALAEAGVNVRAIAQGCSEYNITIVVDQKDIATALTAAHNRFYCAGGAAAVAVAVPAAGAAVGAAGSAAPPLDLPAAAVAASAGGVTTVAVAVVGPGLIGGTFLDQLRDQAAYLLSTYSLRLHVVAIADLRGSLLTTGSHVDLPNWREQLQKEGTSVPLPALTAALTALAAAGKAPGTAAGGEEAQAWAKALGGGGLVHVCLADCTASEAVADCYAAWMRGGITVITPNKKASSGPLARLAEMAAARKQGGSRFYYECTVGAGLPVIYTLRRQLDTGDKLVRCEGIFSGTLSYIFNSLDGSKPFSQIVSEAKAAGYTEPDPRDDLKGMDVARKVVIVAREAGLQLELSDVPVQSLVPKPLENVASADEFLARLPEFDSEITDKLKEAQAANEVLRFVGIVDMAKGGASVELRRYPKTHPFASLTGSDNMISFQTERYFDMPLVVRGPGAGAAVTAAGVFTDLLRLCSHVGAPC